ncbi:peptidase family C78-domain-containing protein [Pyrenochaeta sp. MPI-SDFR-AT-0127]|nr:peptidase family C78-domain-containing protein [Pyrenochaeta sp. MPI-SDFR-AT-0127]
MADRMELLDCPMCDFTVLPSDNYILQLHFEQVHTTDSPFVVEDDPESQPPPLPPRPSSKRKHTGDTPSSDEEETTVACPEPDCGELVSLSDFNDHLDYHAAETLSFDETTGKYHSHHSSSTMQNLAASQHSSKGSSKNAISEHDFNTDLPDALRRNEGHGRKLKKHAPRARSNTSSSEKSTLSRSILSFNPFAKLDKTVKPPNKTARLGKSELGPYAWEDHMPQWLHDQLDAGPKITSINRIGRDGRLLKQEQVQNETPGLIPILAQLSALDRSVKDAYFCHPSTLHIGKTPREGGFCGYRNIQMLLSYIQGSKAQGYEEFPGRTPGILHLQDLIERAWDKGINEIGRVQTGGIRNTRKYIGTPEAQAFFLSSEIDCAVEMFSDNKSRTIEAHEALLTAIERYFAQAAVSDGSNVYKTLLPPIYLQQPGHSLTIVGFERRRDGSRNVMVFDPMYSTSPAMRKLVGRKNIKTARPEVLHAYRRGARQLRKHAAFEVLILTATPPLFPAWDVLRQFPDCRFVYAFFRSRTLGYDVYPEDYFLRNFPWQQYGGLWICHEARFARAEPIDSLTAHDLRCITGDGCSSRLKKCNSPASPFSSNSVQNLPAADAHMRNEVNDQPLSFIPFLEESKSALPIPAKAEDSSTVLRRFSRQGSPLPQPVPIRPTLSLLTEVGRKYPGFPTPLSPTLSAKDMFPSPATESVGGAATSCANSPAYRTVSPVSVDESEMWEPYPHQDSHRYEKCALQMSLIDSVLSGHSQESCFHGASPQASSLRAPSVPPPSFVSPTSPTSPSRCVSPRTAMLKNMVGKRALQNLSHKPTGFPAPGFVIHQNTINAYSPSKKSSVQSLSPPPSPQNNASPPLSINIANGTEINATSPIDPSGTMLLYRSNRNVDSGLLGVRPLSEAQVAEYRFWRPCGRKVCAFGCGGAHEGENAAARRLFKGVEDIKAEEEVDTGGAAPAEAHTAIRSNSSQRQVKGVGQESGSEDVRLQASVWAGRRLVTDWTQFLTGCEREGVARF